MRHGLDHTKYIPARSSLAATDLSAAPSRPKSLTTKTRTAANRGAHRSANRPAPFSAFCIQHVQKQKTGPALHLYKEVKRHGRLFQSTIEFSNTQSMPENTCMRQEGPAADSGRSPASKRAASLCRARPVRRRSPTPVRRRSPTSPKRPTAGLLLSVRNLGSVARHEALRRVWPVAGTKPRRPHPSQSV